MLLIDREDAQTRPVCIGVEDCGPFCVSAAIEDAKNGLASKVLKEANEPGQASGGTCPALALCPGKSEVQGMKTAISVNFSHLEAMRVDGQQPEQSPAYFLWTSVNYESKLC
jgi:hypothetical protein